MKRIRAFTTIVESNTDTDTKEESTYTIRLDL